jgi:hypothetical protein
LLEGALHKEPAERGPQMEEFGRQLRRIEHDLEQGLVPAIMDTVALHTPDVHMPPTRMLVPLDAIDLGTRHQGERHTISFPISNEGAGELRVVMRANVPWVHTPEGQLRVPPGSLVRVPMLVDMTTLPYGQHKARIELDGNGGLESVPIEVTITYWWLTGAGVLMVASVGAVLVLAIVALLLRI